MRQEHEQLSTVVPKVQENERFVETENPTVYQFDTKMPSIPPYQFEECNQMNEYLHEWLLSFVSTPLNRCFAHGVTASNSLIHYPIATHIIPVVHVYDYFTGTTTTSGSAFYCTSICTPPAPLPLFEVTNSPVCKVWLKIMTIEMDAR